MRTQQQKTGDRLEVACLQLVHQYTCWEDARLTKGSGNVHLDGDISGVDDMHLECKNSEAPGKGRSITKKDWAAIKSRAYKRCLTPVHLGFDDDGEVVALVPFRDLLSLIRLARKDD